MTGRTKAMVMDLHDGDTVVVHAWPFSRYVKAMIRDLRGPIKVNIVAVGRREDIDRLRGLKPDSVRIDHAFWAFAPIVVRAELRAFKLREVP